MGYRASAAHADALTPSPLAPAPTTSVLGRRIHDMLRRDRRLAVVAAAFAFVAMMVATAIANITGGLIVD